ncbi:MAG: ParB/RepB/Spo0J family partition protein [Planctomycetota bacterium]|jgi:ParB family chromosome partitioning protein
MLKALLELHAGGIEGEPEMGNSEDIDGVLEKARGIGQVILASRPRGRHARIHVGDMAAMDGLDGSKVSERAIRTNQCSIARFGLLNPLVVRQAGRGFQLLLGYARHEGCRRLGLGKVPALVKDVEDVQAVELALLDILLGNGANHVEPDCLRAVLRFYMEPWRERTGAEAGPGRRRFGGGEHM